MSTSGVYSFGTPQNKDIIEDAYERIGIIASMLTQQQILAAKRTLNFILQTWPNKGNNLWTIRKGLIGLTNNKTAYNLPIAGIDLKTVTIRTSNRNLGGVPFSSAGGNAALAFDNNAATSCSQTAIGGYISYNWGAAQQTISMVGIQPNVTANYGIVAEYSFDNVNWINALTIPVQTYTAGVISWFVIPVPVPANLFRVRQTDTGSMNWSQINFANWNEFTVTPWNAWNETPLNVQELYFNNLLYDTTMSRLSETEYNMIPNKSQTGKPSSFWVDRQINPIVYLWPTPNGIFNCLYCTYWTALQDIGSLINNPEVPARFLEALTAALAYKLGLKQGLTPDKLQGLQMESENAYNQAGDEDSERVPLRIYPDFTGYQ